VQRKISGHIREKLTLRKSSIVRAFVLLTINDRVKLALITAAQVLSGVLDLAGVLIMGAVGALSIRGIESRPTGSRTAKILQLAHLTGISFQIQILILSIAAALLFITKTVFSVIFTRKTFRFLSEKAADISGMLMSKLLSQNLLFIQKRTTQETIFIITDGLRNLTSGILATSVSLAADISMLTILSVGLYVFDPFVAISTTLLFLTLAFFLYQILHVRAGRIGEEVERLVVRSSQKISEVLNTYRETIVHDRRQFYAQNITRLRREYGRISAEQTFQPYISKYVIESVTILGAFTLAGVEFATKDAVHATSILIIFMAASTRIAPAILRVQQGLLMIKSSEGTAKSTFYLIDDLENAALIHDNILIEADKSEDFVGTVSLSMVNFAYENASKFMLSDVTLSIQAGMKVAIVGPSGSGKTTLVDVLLGVHEPQSGTVIISGSSPKRAIKKWPGKISYVPQDVEIIAGTIRENVGMGYDPQFATDELVWEALGIAHLDSVVRELELGIDTEVGEGGSKISGGQRQRLGIARAFFTSPKLIVLDEATSALDGQTESEINKSISSLPDDVTVIIVAHRLSTIRHADQLIYIDQGKIMAKGTFDEVRSQVPDFDAQAKLIGI
jgi:ATP-binding cassette, subfamily B, bacterial PglK